MSRSAQRQDGAHALRVGVVPAILVITAAVLAGCSRAHYRQAADRQVYEILARKSQRPEWTLPRLDITPDPRSRMFDPTNPDCPPLPPDDPTAQRYMESVYGMRGSKRWACLGGTEDIENPDWPTLLNSDDTAEGTLPAIDNLTLAKAVELSLIHSREYQTQLENLYLAALSLTYERYRFDVRPTGLLGDPSWDFEGEPGTELFYQHQPDDRSELGLGPTNLGISKLLPTGGQLVAELANNTLWMFSGPSSAGSATTFAYSLVQPLLAGAGREIVLEDLTLAEREVVYAVRDFARFRKQFFVGTITGGQVAGLQRFLRGFEFLAGEGTAPSVGFFPLLLRLQQLRNRQTIIRTLEFLIEEMQAAEAGQLDAGQLDIARLESSLAYYQHDLIGDTRRFEDRLDQYKVQLGLPPGMEIGLDDSLLEPFQFVDPSLIDLESRLRTFGRQVRALQLPAQPQRLRRLWADLDGLGRLVAEALDLVDSDFRRLDAVLAERFSNLDDQQRRPVEQLIDEQRTLFGQVRDRFGPTIEKLQSLQQTLPDETAAPPQQQALIESIAGLRNDLLLLVRRASFVQVVVRVELVPIQPVDLDMTEAERLALQHRLDLMNRRGRVMDARRHLEIAADALESNLDLVVEGELNTPPLGSNGRAFAFRGRDSRFRAGLGFTTPLDRRAQRNDFRAAQIAYQRARRGYVAFEDQVQLEVRQSVRTIQELSESIVLARRRMQFSARELDLAETQTELAQKGLSLSTALRSLNHAQDDLIEAWLDYETTRLNLYRDVGRMQIDRRGFWLDSFYQQMAADAGQ